MVDLTNGDVEEGDEGTKGRRKKQRQGAGETGNQEVIVIDD